MVSINPVGDRIRTLRKARGLTLDQLAERSSSSKSYIWELENKNPPRPSAEKLASIAQQLGTTLEYLMNGDDAHSQEESEDAHFYRNYKKMDVVTKTKIRRMVELWGDED